MTWTKNDWKQRALEAETILNELTTWQLIENAPKDGRKILGGRFPGATKTADHFIYDVTAWEEHPRHRFELVENGLYQKVYDSHWGDFHPGSPECFVSLPEPPPFKGLFK